MAKKTDGFVGEQRWYIPDSIEQEVLQSSELPELLLMGIGFYPNAKFHFFSRNRRQVVYYVLIYCYAGRGFYEIEGKTRAVSAGDVFVLPPDKAHCYYSDLETPWSIYWLHFLGENVPQYINGLEEPVSLKVSEDSRLEYRISLFEELFNSIQWCDSLPDLKYSTSVLHHFLGTISYYSQFHKSKALTKKQDTADIVSRAIHYMRENIGRRISLNEISNYLGYSTSHFLSQFKQRTGTTPLKYLTNLRIELACKYLSHSNCKVNQICFFVGYENPLYFTRVFCSVKGMPPTVYRRRYKKMYLEEISNEELSQIKD